MAQSKIGKKLKINMAIGNGIFDKNVFINCPFDSKYISLLRPLLFTILYLGYNPRISSESSDSSESRFDKICRLIEDSRISIHDLSRIRSSTKKEFYRLNMALELGVDIGCKLFKHNQKKCLILEKEKYGYQKALSDLSGYDIKSHNNEPQKIVSQVRDWFVTNEKIHIESASKIWGYFNEFTAYFYEKRKKEGFEDEELDIMATPEYIQNIKDWLDERIFVKFSSPL